MVKLDRRVRRTRRRLRDAIIELIIEYGYDNITIQQITDRADLSRATFYLHYRDKDELLAYSLEEMFNELVEKLDTPLFNPKEQAASTETPPIVLAFLHVQQHHELYKALLIGDRGVTYVIYREIQYLARIANAQLAQLTHEAIDEDLVTIASQHLAGSLFSVILWWLQENMPRTPEEMAKLFHTMALPGVYEILGLKYNV